MRSAAAEADLAAYRSTVSREVAYCRREALLRAAMRVLLAERLNHSGPHDAAEQEYADDQLDEAAREFVAVRFPPNMR